MTLRRVRDRQPWLLLCVVALAVGLGMAAAVDSGRLLVWDPLVTDLLVGWRSPRVDQAARWISRLGSTPVVITAGLAGIVLAARRCPHVALVMLVTVATRPPFEWLLKEAIGRPRPAGARLVPGTGFAYPSGHVLAATATWGFVPVIAGLYLKRDWIWRVSMGLAWGLIGLIAWTRVWLGVHWVSDVVGGLAIAFVALTMAETVLERHDHVGAPCDNNRQPRAATGAEQGLVVGSGTRHA